MAVRDRMTPSHQSVEHVRHVVRDAQHKVVGGPAPPVSEFNEETDDCYMADEHDLSVRGSPCWNRCIHPLSATAVTCVVSHAVGISLSHDMRARSMGPQMCSICARHVLLVFVLKMRT